MAQTADIIFRFGADIIHKRRIKSGVSGAGEHEILPDADAEFVAQIVKNIVLVKTAAPDAQHVHIGNGGALNQIGVIFLFQMRGKSIGRYPAGTFGEEPDVVDRKLEGLAPFVRFPLQMQRAQADALYDIIEESAFFTDEIDCYHIQRLFAHAIRPPELRFRDIQLDIAQAFFKGDIPFNHRFFAERNGNGGAGRKLPFL